MNIFLLNGPPGCGKNTIAREISEYWGFQEMEFKAPMYAIGAAITGLTVEEFKLYYNDRQHKEFPSEKFLGVSGRQLFINISEKLIKPTYGKDYFGNYAVRQIHENQKKINYVFSDSGFMEELVPLIDAFGAENISVIQFTGQGQYKFGTNDSRNFLDTEILKYNGVRVINMFDMPNENISPRAYAREIFDRYVELLDKEKNNG